jgi:selenide,water dikinase
MEIVKLTALSHGAGCACKLSPAELHPLLDELPRQDDSRVLVGSDTADDAAAFLVSPELAILTTVDFFTPIVDDPYDFGRIAATNALSDIYAMGGEPLTALNLVAYSLDELGPDVLREILRGGHDATAAAGVAVVGGHSIDDAEPKYGMAVTGRAHPDRIVRNSTALAGHDLHLTKPVGGGVVSTAAKRGLAPDSLVARTIDVMTTLNRDAAAEALDSDLSAMTDVTGFGLLGHLHELTLASGCAAEIAADQVPAIDGVLELTDAAIAGGTRRNRKHAATFTTFADDVREARRWLLCDAMTSGGLLAAVPERMGDGCVVGRLVEGEPGTITVV